MVESGGVLHHGTYEEDSPVTWEALASPREIRCYGEPVNQLRNLARLQAHVPGAE